MSPGEGAVGTGRTDRAANTGTSFVQRSRVRGTWAIAKDLPRRGACEFRGPGPGGEEARGGVVAAAAMVLQPRNVSNQYLSAWNLHKATRYFL